jgi:hypothetical protein
MGAGFIASAELAKAKKKPATAINLIIFLLPFLDVAGVLHVGDGVEIMPLAFVPSHRGLPEIRLGNSPNVRFGSMLLKKDFGGGSLRNIDSRSRKTTQS